MDRIAEQVLFQDLGRGRVFREWIEMRLAKEIEILTVHQNVEELRKAQGRAQLLTEMKKMAVQVTP